MKAVAAATAIVMAGSSAHSDEGMWLFNDPPRTQLKERYGFEITDAWLEHVQKAAVRFNSGGSGAFVSPDGLVISNFHVGADALQKLDSAEKNYMRDGFHARSRLEELRCHDLELNVLFSIEDVSERVQAALKPEMTPEQAFAARRASMAAVEKESLERTGLRSDVVTLFQGAKDHLYRYKKYTDVRLVFAPEYQIAMFGGDPDNFEFPRYGLDFCFFRAYENGEPAKIEHYLKWHERGPAENELVFIAGNPGRTSRLLTVAELEYQRDEVYPRTLDYLNAWEVALSAYSARSEENARRAKDMLYGIMNNRKRGLGAYQAILNPELINDQRAREQKLRAALAAAERVKLESAYERIASAQKIIAENALRYQLIETSSGFSARYFQIARTLVRSAAERPKPNGDRLREFRESNRESLEFELFSEEPLYDDFEQMQLGQSLTYLARRLSLNDPVVQIMLEGKTPDERAAQLVRGATIKDPKHRRELYRQESEFFTKSHDPLIRLVVAMDPEARAVRKLIEAQEEVKRQAHAEIAAARNKIEGISGYPDATFTLRLAFGRAAGYEENGQAVPYQTTFRGLYERAASQHFRPPYDLPERWIKAKDQLDLGTPFNFVATTDSIGGNSGSPMINRQGEFIGINFDRNVHGLGRDFYYTDLRGRNIAVHAGAIIEALRRVYGAHELATALARPN
jgi:hypothetical protein